MFSKKRIASLSLLFCVLFSVAGQSVLTPQILSQNRWYNDEFSFDFKDDETVISYFTLGATTGTLRGTWKIENDSKVIIRTGTMDSQYNSTPISNNILTLHYSYNESDPKSQKTLFGGPGDVLKLWNKGTFTPKNREIELQPGNIPCVTTGYALTATTDNLRLRKGPGIEFENQIYTYLDSTSKTVKTFTSMFKGTNLRILARTKEKMKVLDWYNYWYYVEYKEPLGSMIVYRNAWMFGEFLSVEENKTRWVRIGSPANEEAMYNDYMVTVEGTTAGSPVTLRIQIKDAYGNVVKEIPIDNYDQVRGTFSHRLSKENTSLFIGSNTINIVALYSDKKVENKQITFFVHESMGERAKPVIYLYPREEMEISVEVKPRSGFSRTEPDYNNGWKVIAQPDGTLYNRADGKIYPYLFWESNSEKRPETDAGFVVEQDQLPPFFREKLAILGMKDTEITDFLDFWIPLLNKGAYYYISFIDQKIQEEDAPLLISPEPDSIIRIFFDSRPLTEEISVAEQKLIPRERQGFSVVEWGGMRYRN